MLFHHQTDQTTKPILTQLNQTKNENVTTNHLTNYSTTKTNYNLTTKTNNLTANSSAFNLILLTNHTNLSETTSNQVNGLNDFIGQSNGSSVAELRNSDAELRNSNTNSNSDYQSRKSDARNGGPIILNSTYSSDKTIADGINATEINVINSMLLNQTIIIIPEDQSQDENTIDLLMNGNFSETINQWEHFIRDRIKFNKIIDWTNKLQYELIYMMNSSLLLSIVIPATAGFIIGFMFVLLFYCLKYCLTSSNQFSCSRVCCYILCCRCLCCCCRSRVNNRAKYAKSKHLLGDERNYLLVSNTESDCEI